MTSAFVVHGQVRESVCSIGHNARIYQDNINKKAKHFIVYTYTYLQTWGNEYWGKGCSTGSVIKFVNSTNLIRLKHINLGLVIVQGLNPTKFVQIWSSLVWIMGFVFKVANRWLNLLAWYSLKLLLILYIYIYVYIVV